MHFIRLPACRFRKAVRRGLPAALAGLAVLGAAGTACQRRTVQVYEIPKQPGDAAAALVAARPDGQATVTPVRWAKPAGWQAQPLSEMRQGSFRVEGPGDASADVSVVSFPGEAGGLVSNLNRWRGQVELPALSADELRQEARTVTAGPVQGILVDYASPPQSAKQSRILGAVFETADRSWFVKMTGPPALVESQKEIFAQFVRSFQFFPPAPERDTNPPGRPKSSNDQ